MDVLGLPVSYNGHTSLVVVKEPFAANTSSSCILYMDSIAGGNDFMFGAMAGYLTKQPG